MANEIEKRNEAFLIYQDENGIATKHLLSYRHRAERPMYKGLRAW